MYAMEKQRNQQSLQKDLQEKNTVVSFLPKDIDIEITSFCNYRCAMCPHALAGNTQASHLPPQVWECLKPLLPYCKRVMLQGDGEPLLYPRFKEMVEELAGYGAQICMTTNLSLLTEDLAGFLDWHFTLLTVSCDGGTPETYESIRRGGDFAQFAQNLQVLTRHMDAGRIMVNTVVMRQNMRSLVPLLAFLKQSGIRQVMFSSLLTTNYLQNEADTPMRYPHIAAKMLEEAKAYADGNGISLAVNWDYKIQEDIPKERTEWESLKKADQEAQSRIYTAKERQRFQEAYQRLHQVEKIREVASGQYHCEGICKNLYEKLYVDVSGNLTLCCFGKTKGVGNLLEDGLDGIWNGAVYQACRQAFFEGNLPDFCIGCRYAMLSSCQAVQAYPFHVADMDQAFFDDEVFWENR